MFGLAAPDDRRGHPLESLLADVGALRSAPAPVKAETDGPTRDEDEDVRERLRGLGYIE